MATPAGMPAATSPRSNHSSQSPGGPQLGFLGNGIPMTQPPQTGPEDTAAVQAAAEQIEAAARAAQQDQKVQRDATPLGLVDQQLKQCFD
eukprot:5961885-Alexandrium_andersonii.AAC.1